MSAAVEHEDITATTEGGGELYVQGKPNVMFRSRRKRLRLTMEARYPIINPVTGQTQGVTKGKFVAFQEGADGGYISFPATGVVKLIDSLDGNQAEVDAEELIEWLENHRLFGDLYEGFWRETIEAPAVSRDELQAIIDATLDFDVEKLTAIVEQERGGWAREDIIGPAQNALERIARAQAEIEAAGQ